MKPSALLSTALLFCFCSALPAAPTEEQQQIAILQSDSSPQQKDAACARLKRIGTGQSVPALAALLTDEQLSHSARYALESMPLPEAARALIDALDKTTGLTRAGIINSLGNRRETGAVPDLSKILQDPDAIVTAPAAVALGKMATPEAVTALRAALPGASEAVHAALLDGLLRSANQLLEDGNATGAFAIFQQLHQPKEKEHIRTAAYEGMIRAGGERALGFVSAGIEGTDPADQIAALQLARDIKDPAATRALSDLLPKSSPAVQIALIGVLSQRGDLPAGSAVLALAKSQDPAVRLAATTALATIGDASAVPVLAEATVAQDEAEQKAARQSLLDLRHGNVTEALIGQMASARPAVQAELARALAGRAEKSTVPKLLELARSGADAARAASLRALGLLADGTHVASLVQLLVEAKTESARSEIQQALAAVCQRAQATPGLDVGPIVNTMSSGSAEVRIALAPVCSVLAEPRVRAALRSAVAGSDARLRNAAIRALCDSRDPELLPDLLTIVRTTPEANLRALAMRGYVRLATEEGSAKSSDAQRASLLQQVLALANGPEEERMILARVADIPAPEALQLVLPFLDGTEAQAEAAQAATQIASAIRGVDAELARSALKRVLAVTTDASRREAAESILKQMDAATDFITAWQVAGPYLQEGKDYAALFDIPFAPENPDAKDVTWRLLPNSTDPKQPGLLDLLKFLGGQQRVAYARTRVYSDKQQGARLELGSDDGIKVWLNGKVVHAHNTARAVTAGADKVNIALNQGWNNLLVKVTQNNQGWGFCARLVAPDGSRIGGIRF